MKTTKLLTLSGLLFAAGCQFAAVSAVLAGIREDQVLVVYNSQATDATTLKNYYLAAHPSIPAANVLDLNSSFLNTADLTYSSFVTLVRDPIRAYLLQPGSPPPQSIVAICLIRPLPHRIQDINAGESGDDPNLTINQFVAGNATNASVDAELVLLWQNLSAGEANGTMDSYADNVIVNPYHKLSSGIDTFSRANITASKTFVNDQNYCWLLGGSGASQLTPGDMYLVCRLDGYSLADAETEIDRARNLYVNKVPVKCIFDEYNLSMPNCPPYDNDGLFTNDANDPFWGGNDYEATRDALLAGGWNVRYDATYTFITSTLEPAPIIAYASYGENHGNSGCGQLPSVTYIRGFNFPPGAIFNTMESYNARGLNGLTPLFNQEQVADFIASGGTFAVGNVYEPFAFAVPDNLFLMPNMMMNGLTFAEAAYSSLPALSWQQLALGDPLGKMIILNDPGLPKGDMNGDGHVDGLDIAWFVDVLTNGTARYHAAFPSLDPVARGDFTGDYRFTIDDLPGFRTALLTAP